MSAIEELMAEITRKPDPPEITVDDSASQSAQSEQSASQALVPLREGRNGGKLRTGNPGNKGGTGRPPNVLRKASREVYWRWLKWAAKQLNDPNIKPETALGIGAIAPKYGLPANALLGDGQTPGVIVLPLQDLAGVQRAREQARVAAAEEVGVIEVPAPPEEES